MSTLQGPKLELRNTTALAGAEAVFASQTISVIERGRGVGVGHSCKGGIPAAVLGNHNNSGKGIKGGTQGGRPPSGCGQGQVRGTEEGRWTESGIGVQPGNSGRHDATGGSTRGTGAPERTYGRLGIRAKARDNCREEVVRCTAKRGGCAHGKTR